ncbi:hypothetical protein NEHOM01_2048 [Nematocida homosporus]|uniref:uncharacterized protein n=1 Tax=Nematocida homosporus TaxID=1912981 RepID=UPI00221F45D1|nr:uncharacterized protein NEHOM01_2048 [Nematocida homosporus]KAI5187257.1 hypothetical protein NEHOM01_2048 [Nematocida homosporus]
MAIHKDDADLNIKQGDEQLDQNIHSNVAGSNTKYLTIKELGHGIAVSLCAATAVSAILSILRFFAKDFKLYQDFNPTLTEYIKICDIASIVIPAIFLGLLALYLLQWFWASHNFRGALLRTLVCLAAGAIATGILVALGLFIQNTAGTITTNQSIIKATSTALALLVFLILSIRGRIKLYKATKSIWRAVIAITLIFLIALGITVIFGCMAFEPTAIRYYNNEISRQVSQNAERAWNSLFS